MIWEFSGTSNPTTCNDTFGTRFPATGGTMLSAGGAASAVMQNVTGLLQGTTYWVCAIATNVSGTAFGAPVSGFPSRLHQTHASSIALLVWQRECQRQWLAVPHKDRLSPASLGGAMLLVAVLPAGLREQWQGRIRPQAGLFGAVTLQDLVARAETLGVTRAAGQPQMYFI